MVALKLSELDGCWLADDSQRRWLLFRSPTGHHNWLTCKNFVASIGAQIYEICTLKPELRENAIVACEEATCWKIIGTLENLTVTPSINASRSGNWHGFITNGQVLF